jgi:hypothetical protein
MLCGLVQCFPTYIQQESGEERSGAELIPQDHSGLYKDMLPIRQELVDQVDWGT